jgi:hypothetical protein
MLAQNNPNKNILAFRAQQEISAMATTLEIHRSAPDDNLS